MILTGTLAALSMRHVSKRWSGFGDIARKAPYFSCALIIVIGLYLGGYQDLHNLLLTIAHVVAGRANV